MAVAFKEWSLVCEALGAGRQSLVLRKGGIAEGRAGFQWKHEGFYLLPTYFHEQTQQLVGAPIAPPAPADGAHVVSLFAKLEFHGKLTDWGVVERLRPYHSWTEEVLGDRFDYTGQRSLSVACLRVFALAQPLQFPDAPSYGGCRSWVNIPVSDELPAMSPVLGDSIHADRVAALKSILGALT